MDNSVTYRGPDYSDFDLVYRLPKSEGFPRRETRATASAARCYHLDADAIDDDQAHVLLSLRDVLRVFAEKRFASFHPVFSHFLTLPLAALVLEDLEMLAETTKLAEGWFKRCTENPRLPRDFAARLDRHAETILAILAENGWTPESVAASQKGRKRPEIKPGLVE